MDGVLLTLWRRTQKEKLEREFSRDFLSTMSKNFLNAWKQLIIF